ncbi:Zn-dependent protease with chaperone function [Stackebrandtia albiflava]|uniref:Zn-dependent protease with chaperone function n=1 Tax=Stackebrandtia albiflava TaxID=406432 RepID=A0A562V3B9_9ACTN|nr:M48 family metallopeptidase [Stackebrandtia albiflava]TWJ12312.1 Zn-dependent protease with chaperone function [Stackebrandtia albiflava]
MSTVSSPPSPPLAVSAESSGSRALTSFRAGVSLVLLVGFYVFALAVAAGMVWGAVALVTVEVHRVTVALAVLACVLAGAILLGLFKAVRPQRHEPEGMEVSRQDAPGLWEMAEDTARRAGTRAPEEIRLVPEVNAAVSEDTRFLGLSAGRRYLYVGMPLLVTFSKSELRSVIAHEMGHYAHVHTRLGAISYRGRLAIGHVQHQLSQQRYNLVGWLFKAYSYLYLAVQNSISRKQELEADRLSGRIAGRDAARSALQRLNLLAVAWNFYVGNYVNLGLDRGLAPRGIFASFPTIIAAREAEFAAAAAELAARPAARWSTHPATPVRVAALESAPEHGEVAETGPATDLVAGFDRVAATMEAEAIGLGGHRLLDWEDYSPQAIMQHQREVAEAAYRAIARVSGEERGRFGFVLDEIEAGHGPRLFPALGGANFPEGGLGAIVWIAAYDSDALTVAHRWDAPLLVERRNGEPFSVKAILEPLSESPESAALVREALVASGIDLEKARGGQAEVFARQAQVMGAIGSVKLDDVRGDLFITDEGLLFLAGAKGGLVKRRLKATLADNGVAELRAMAGARWLPFEELRSGEAKEPGILWTLAMSNAYANRDNPIKVTLTTTDGATHRLASTNTTDALPGSRDLLYRMVNGGS